MKKITFAVTTHDLLGRTLSTITPLGVTSNFYDGATTRLRRTTRSGTPDTLYTYDALGNLTQTVSDSDGNGQVDYGGSDRISATAQTYAEDIAGIWWHVTTQTHSCGGVTNATTTTRTLATELSPWCLACTVSVAPNGETSTVSRAFAPEMDAIVETTQRSTATPTLRRTLYGYQIEAAGLGTATLFSYDGFARVKSQAVTNAFFLSSSSVLTSTPSARHRCLPSHLTADCRLLTADSRRSAPCLPFASPAHDAPMH